jgi:hypothetical protein
MVSLALMGLFTKSPDAFLLSLAPQETRIKKDAAIMNLFII